MGQSSPWPNSKGLTQGWVTGVTDLLLDVPADILINLIKIVVIIYHVCSEPSMCTWKLSLKSPGYL